MSMQEEVVACFNAIYKSGDQEQILQGNGRLQELLETPEIIPCLLSVALTSEDKTFKAASTIFLNEKMAFFWEATAEIHGQLYEAIPQLVSQADSSSMEIVIRFATVVLENSLQGGECGNIIADIQQFCSDGSTIYTGLILCVALSEVISQNENEEGVLAGLTVPLIEFIIQIIQQVEDLDMLSYMFTSINNILINSYVQYFNENFGAFEPILTKFMYLERADDSEQYQRFSKSAADFMVIFLAKYTPALDEELIGTMFALMKSMIVTEVLIPYVKADVLKAMYSLMKIDGFFQTFVQEGAEELFAEVLFPLFAVSQEELEVAVSDPKAFTDELHKSSEDFNDFKETATMIIRHLSSEEDNDYVREVIFGVLLQKIQEFSVSEENINDQAQLFAAAHFFSAAADSFGLFCKPLLTQLINEVAPLFENESEVVRAAAFLMLSRVHADLQTPIVIQCIHGTVDDSHFVRYYAMAATANLLEKADESSADAIQAEFAESIEELMTAFLETCNEFDDSEVKGTLTEIVRFFGDYILPFATQICQELITMIAECGKRPEDDEEAFDNAIKVNQSLANLVELVSDRSDELNDFAQAAFVLCIQALQEMTNSALVDPFIETIFQILECCSTFVPEFWQITEAVVPHYTGQPDEDSSIGACCELFSLLLLKDEEFAAREDVCGPVVEFVITQMQENMPRPDSWNELARLCEGIVLRLPAESPLLQQHFQLLCEMTLHQLIETNTLYNDIDGAVLLLNALLIRNFAGVQAVAGERFNDYLGLWIQWPVFPETCVAIMTNAEAVASNAQLQFEIINAALNQLFEDILSKSETDDEFDQTVDKDGIVWFDFGETLMQFYQFIQQIQETNPTLFESIKARYEEEEFNDIVRIPNIAELYTQTKNEKAKTA